MKRFIKLPHAVWGAKLNAGELQVYTAIASHANRFGSCCVRYSVLAKLCSISISTVIRAVEQLQAEHLLTMENRYNRQGQLVANRYILAPLPGAFTKVPREIWGYKLAKSDFKVYLYLLRCRAENNTEVFPSLSQMVSALHMSKRTIVDAISALSRLLLLHKEQYHRKQDNRLGHNRYLLIAGNVRLLLVRVLAALAAACKKERRTTLSNRVARQKTRNMPFAISKIAHVVRKVKDFLCSRAFFLRPSVLFTWKWVGTILIRQ